MKAVFLLLLVLAICFISGAQTFTDSDLPIVVINTNNQSIVDDPRIVADMGIIYNGPGQRNYLSDPFSNYNGKISIEIRGSTSQQYPKKSYGLETEDDFGNNNNVPLLGMPPENDWILYAPYPDKTMMRNVLCYDLFRRMGHYSPRTRYCELVINNQYEGVYVLEEKIKRDSARLGLATMWFHDTIGYEITGGFIIKVDKTTGSGNYYWQSAYDPKVKYQYHDPQEDSLDANQRQYIETFVNDFEDVMWGSNFADPTQGYRAYINPESFIDFIIMQELGRTVDGYRSSSFLYKDKDTKDLLMHAGPMWDFNLSFGNADYCDAFLLNGWQYEFNTVCPNFSTAIPFWWKKLTTDPAFADEWRCRWNTLRQGPLNTDSMMTFVDSVALVLDESQQRNFIRWPIIGQYVNWNYFVGNSYQEEINYLKDWLTNRSAWMDNNIPGTCTVGSASNAKVDAVLVFPNPASDHFYLRFHHESAGPVHLELRDVSGRLFAMKNADLPAGLCELRWDTENTNCAPGVYTWALFAGSTIQRGKLVIERW